MIGKEEIWKHARHVWTVGSQELRRLEETIDREALSRCVEVIGNCKGRILTAGVGTSGVAAKKIAHTLSCIKRPSFFLSPGEPCMGHSEQLKKGMWRF